MAETIETFVAKLQSEGVQAGRQAAEKIQAEARRQAEETVQKARQEAEKIVADARKEAESILARTQTELQLASRDAAMRLRAALNRALAGVLKRGAAETLSDTGFVGTVLHELVMLYARSDAAVESGLKINVPPEMRQKLIDWAIREIGQEVLGGKHLPIDLKGTLAQAGFEYSVSGATVEVTLDSVVEVLSEMVGPDVRKLFDEALADEKPKD